MQEKFCLKLGSHYKLELEGPFNSYVTTKEWFGGSENGNFSFSHMLKMSLHIRWFKKALKHTYVLCR